MKDYSVQVSKISLVFEKFKKRRNVMSANQQLETTGSRSIVSSRFKPLFGTIGANGYEYLPGVEVTDEQMVDEGKRILGAYDYAEGMKPYVIISFVRQSEMKLGESASQLYDMFKVQMPNLKNMLPVYDRVDHSLWSPGLAFEIMKEVASLSPESQAALIEVAREGVVSKGERRKMVLKEFQKRRAVFLNALPADHPDAKFAKAASKHIDGSVQTADATAPFKAWVQVSFRAPEAKEDVKKTWLPAARKAAIKSATESIDEALKGYVDPKYAAKKQEDARKTEFAELIKDVPKADRQQFVDRFDNDESMSEIKWAVGQYQTAKADADALDALLKTVVDETKCAEFQKQAQTPGVQIKTVKADIETYNKRLEVVKTINDELDTAKITDPVKRAEFIAQLDAEPTVKLASIKSAIKKAGGAEATKAANVTAITTALDEAKITDETQRAGFIARLETEKVGAVKADVKKAGKDAVAETNRKAGIDALLNEIPEAQRSDFLATANVNGTVKDFKDKATAWKAAKVQENKGAVDKRREARKEERANATKILKLVNQKQAASNQLREAGQVALADAEDEQIAALQAQADEIVERTDREEAEDKLLLGIPAHPKPSASSTAKPKGKKKVKKAAHRGNKRG